MDTSTIHDTSPSRGNPKIKDLRRSLLVKGLYRRQGDSTSDNRHSRYATPYLTASYARTFEVLSAVAEVQPLVVEVRLMVGRVEEV